MRLDYFLYMAEAEGVDSIVSTRTAKINAIIKDFINAAKDGYDINENEIQEYIFNKHDIKDLSSEEFNYIKEAVEDNLY